MSKAASSPGPEPRAVRLQPGEHGEDPPFDASRCLASHWPHDGGARLPERAYLLAPAWASAGRSRRQHAELGEVEDRPCYAGALASCVRDRRPEGQDALGRLDEQSEQSPVPALRGGAYWPSLARRKRPMPACRWSLPQPGCDCLGKADLVSRNVKPATMAVNDRAKGNAYDHPSASASSSVARPSPATS